MAAAMRWVAQVTNIGFEMAAPALLGWWLDSLWGTGPWLLIVGAFLGLTAALLHLVRLANASQREHSKRGNDSRH